MGRRLRIQRPEMIFHVSNKCAEDRLWLRPDGRLNALVERWLARALRVYKIELFAYCFMGNHFHLLVRAPLCNLHQFMAYFQRNLSYGVGTLRGQRGSVFPQRFKSQPVLDDGAADALLSYILLNPVRARLVEHASQWPGCSALPQLLGSQEANERIPITPLASWRDTSPEARIERVQRIVDEGRPPSRPRPRRQRGPRRNQRRPGAVLGASRAATMSWRWRPTPALRSPQPWCHTSRAELRTAYRESYDVSRAAYTCALLQWRRGRAVRFPPGTLPPGWLRCAEAIVG